MSGANEKVFIFPKQSDGAIGDKRSHPNRVLHIDEIAAISNNHLNGGDNVENDKLLEKYLDTIDQDRRDMEKRLTEDMLERESKVRDEMNKHEERIEKLLETINLDNKERENRYFKLAEDIRRENKELKDNIKDEMIFIKDELNMTRQDISNLTKHNESLATTNKWSNVATIIGISAIVVSVIVALITFFIML